MTLPNSDTFLPHPFPTETSFSAPIFWTALLVLVPGLVLSAVAPDGELSRFWQLLVGNWISPFIAWFFAGSLWFLLKKRRLLLRERAFSQAVEQECLAESQTEAGTAAPRELIEQRIQAAYGLDKQQASMNLLVQRLRTLTQPFGENADAEGSHQSELDRLEQSYAMVRFMIWAIPILGFIGTVWGISGAVGHFSEAMNNVESASGISEALRDNLPLVTRNLGTAFDTTFLALILSLPLMWILTALQKQEETYLATLHEHWNRDFLPRFSPAAEKRRGEDIPAIPTVTAPAVAGQEGEREAVGPQLAALAEQVRALSKAVDDYAQTMLLRDVSEASKNREKAGQGG